ncbi:AP-5 complex subunit beta-1 [Ambystoma mexicanum]|uniref:AP-5 complex subunit beta-1 n=1 Tax=Ambystoma mexicanum TaxID=8296 RepID=UPI0037E839C6
MLGRKNGSNWSQQLISFRSSPTHFLTNTTLESFLGELLQDLQSEKLNEQIKVSMLTLFAEFPTHLCPDQKTGEHVADVLMTIFAQISDSSRMMTLKHHILVSIETLLITTDNFNLSVKSAQAFVSLLMQIIADLNDKKLGSIYRALRIMACECLRELENCYPGLLSQRLELLYSMQQQEITHAHQSYTLLYSVALKNAVQRLAQTKSTSDGSLKEVLSSNGGFSWIATENTGSLSTAEEQFLLLPSNGETKELKSILALILEDSYLLTSVSQSTLLWQLIQVVAVVRTLSPIIFKSQLVRLFGTMDVSLFHSILQMKGFFTDSLFTAEDEYVLLKRLVGMAQHPLLSTPVKLFYIDCLLHFPENRPLNSNSEENLPVLLTVKMTTSLFPTVFNDSSTMLSRQNILSLVYLENEGAEAETGIGYIMDHLLSIQKIVTEHGNREITAIFFRVVYLFVRYFNFCEKQMEDLIQTVLDVYKKNSALAPYLINLMNETQKLLDVPSWSMALSVALQKLIVDLPLNELVSQLVCHLKILARIAKEHLIPQATTVQFLSNIAVHTDLGDWRTGNAVLTVCKNLLQHQKLDVIFTELADLLQHLSLNFEDIDIQDRARFYYTLLANLSSEKLTGILSMVPAGSQTKTRSMSSIMADSENVSTHLTVHTIEQPVLHLSRVLVSNSFATFSDSTMSDMCMNDYCLKKYYERLTTSMSSSMLTLKYSLSITENAKSQYHKLFCLVFQFELSDSNYEPVSDISVPCLFEDRKSPIMSLILKPKRPYPTELYVTAMYTTQEGLTCHSRLEPLKINFSDIFVPFPVPTTWRLEDRCQLFDELWTSFKPSESNSCAESLFCFQDQQSLREFVQLFFSRFVVSTDSDLYKIGFFLPPQFHILMQVKMLDETVHVRIATDNWKLLPYLSSYLQCITSRG